MSDPEGFEEHIAESTLTMGQRLSEGVPSRSYSEFEIQTLLNMHFQMLDYEVIRRHREDPANEDMASI